MYNYAYQSLSSINNSVFPYNIQICHVFEWQFASQCIRFYVTVFYAFHCENTPLQYTAIFQGCKNDNFYIKKCDIFLIFAQNMDCG